MNETIGYNIAAEHARDFQTPYGKWFKEEKSRKRLTRWCIMLAFILGILMVVAHIVDTMIIPLPHGVEQHLTN